MENVNSPDMILKEKRCKANKSEFREIWPGVKRCMECGFAVAYKEEGSSSGNEDVFKREESLHSTYHGKYYKVKSQYGSQNVLSFKELERQEKEIGDLLNKLKEYDISDDTIKVKNTFDSILGYMTEINKWGKTYKEINIEMYKELKEKINSVRFYARKKDSEDIQEVLNALNKILKELRDLFVLIDRYSCNLNTAMVDNYIERPSFTFNRDTVITKLEEKSQIIPAKLGKLTGVLDEFFRIEYTKSLRLWDMCKAHPKFEDYKTLLWNTPKFLNYISNYLTVSQFNNLKQSNKANRFLVDSKYEEAPFYFGKVGVTSYANEENIIDLSHLNKILEMKDNEEEDNLAKEYMKSKEYKEMKKAIEQLSKISQLKRKI